MMTRRMVRAGARRMRMNWSAAPERSAAVALALADGRSRPDADRRRASSSRCQRHRSLEGLYVYFLEPLTLPFTLQELVVKAIPLAIIAVGLASATCRNTWNIGAEGQLDARRDHRLAASPILLPDFQNICTLPLMLLLGILGGALYGAIPAFLKTRFGTNEILTSLMLVYVAGHSCSTGWCAGRSATPKGFGFPAAARSPTSRSCRPDPRQPRRTSD